MNASNITFQSPQPYVYIYSPDNKDNPKFTFCPSKNTNNIASSNGLQSYQFSLSNNDIQGSFSLTLFPDIVTRYERVPLWDKINVRDIVMICEGSAENEVNETPVFTGVVNRKKYVMQAGDGGASRRLSISGMAITSLVSQFKLNLDTRAMVLQLKSATEAQTKQTSIAATLNNIHIDNTKDKAKDIIKTLWNEYIRLSNQYGTAAISKEIETFLTDDFVECDNVVFKYPMSGGMLINSSSTQDFNSLLDTLFPAPLYEKTAYTAADGIMKIRIRQVPFDDADWEKLTCYEISPNHTKSIDLEQSDKEVYTVFFSYLNGSPTSQDFNYILSAVRKGSDLPTFAQDKFAIYGFRPLNCTFYGYKNPDSNTGETGNDKKNTENTDDAKEQAAKEQTANDSDTLRSINEKLSEWYSNLDTMLQGSLSLAMTYNGNSRIMPGDKVSLLGCEFYVEGIAHSWNYGGGGDINISLSRGGEYNKGKYSDKNPPADFTDALKMFKEGENKETGGK